MNLEQALLADRSKENMQKIVRYITKNTSSLPELLRLIASDKEEKIQMRAAWVLGYLGSLENKEFAPHYPFLLEVLEDLDRHPTVIRSITRLFQYVEVPESYQGRFIDICFQILLSPQQLSAQRANSMTILHHYSQLYPEIANELEGAILNVLETQSDASLVRRGNKVLKSLRKIKTQK